MSTSDSGPEFGTFGALFRRRRVWILTIVPAFLLASVFLAYTITPQYRSTATMILEAASIPDQLIQTTVNSAPDQQIEIIQGRALNVPALADLVKSFDPYPNQPNLSPEQKAVLVIANTSLERVDPVTFKPLEKSPAFSMSYQNPNPYIAAETTRQLVGLFLNYHQRTRVEAAQAGARLLEERSRSLTQELGQVDQDFARLRAQFGGALPDSTGFTEEARYRAIRDQEALEKDLRNAQEQVEALSVQLNGTAPNLLSSKGDLTDLSSVRAQLADAQQRYTPDHPDVKRLQRALAALMAQQGPGGATAGGADNPEYRRIAAQLSAAKNEVAALQSATARARAQVAQYTAKLNPSTEVAQRVADLDRRRSALQAQFQDVQTKLKSAQMGTAMEADDDHAERFTMVRAPYLASSPFAPNRPGLILLGLVLGCVVAAVAVAVAENSDVTVRGTRDLVALTEAPILGSIAEILLPATERRRKVVWGSVAAVYVVAALLVVGTIWKANQRDFRSGNTAQATARAS